MSDLPNTAMGTLSLIGFDKNTIKKFSEKIIYEIKEGNADALKAYIFFNAFDKISKKVKDSIKSIAIDEAEKYGKSFNHMGFDCEMGVVNTRYDYSACLDAYYDSLVVEMNKLEEKIKAREAFLRSIREKLTIVNDETGEVSEIFPPIKKQTDGIIIK